MDISANINSCVIRLFYYSGEVQILMENVFSLKKYKKEKWKVFLKYFIMWQPEKLLFLS